MLKYKNKLKNLIIIAITAIPAIFAASCDAFYKTSKQSGIQLEILDPNVNQTNTMNSQASKYFEDFKLKIRKAVSLTNGTLTVHTDYLPNADEYEKFVYQIGKYSAHKFPVLEDGLRTIALDNYLKTTGKQSPSDDTFSVRIESIKNVKFIGSASSINLDIFQDVHADLFDFSQANKLTKIIGRGKYYTTKNIIFPTNGVLEQIGSNAGLRHISSPSNNSIYPKIHFEEIDPDITKNHKLGFIESPFQKLVKNSNIEIPNSTINTITIPASVKYIYGPSFANLGFNNLKIPANSKLEYIGYKAFYNSRLKSLDLTNATNLKYIGNQAFAKDFHIKEFSKQSPLKKGNVMLPSGLTYSRFVNSFK